jgi:N-acetylmuramoyl-L-alanine amidase
MIFVSAGHNPGGVKPDPGAIGNGKREADLTLEFRNLVTAELHKQGAKFITDNDNERLGEYLSRIKTGTGSVVLEFHFDAAANAKATGTTVLIGGDADKNDKDFAKELAEATAAILGIKNRGVISETESHRGRLGLMKEEGILALLEICFISNPSDLSAYEKYKTFLAAKIAAILIKYEALI